MNKKLMIASVAASAAIVLSGITVQAPVENNAPTPGVTLSKVGKIVPVNMLLGSAKFSSTKAFADECCGPYAQCKICSY